MNTNTKEMSYNELNTQIDELKNRLNEIVSERNRRKEEAVSNWKLHMKLLMEDTELLVEMGIDPSTLSFDDMELSCDNISVSENIEAEQSTISDEKGGGTKNDIIVESEPTESVKSEIAESVVCEGVDIQEPTPDAEDTCSDSEPHLLTPYFMLYGLDKSEKKGKKENINPITGKGMVSKFYTPYFELYEDKVKKLMKMGNLKYKESYPDPEETRIGSADGCCPTLTYTHSDLYVWIGPKYDKNGKKIIPATPIVEKAA